MSLLSLDTLPGSPPGPERDRSHQKQSSQSLNIYRNRQILMPWPSAGPRGPAEATPTACPPRVPGPPPRLVCGSPSPGPIRHPQPLTPGHLASPGHGGHLSGPRAPGKGPPFSRGCAPHFGSHQTNAPEAGFAHRRPRAGLNAPSPGTPGLAVALGPWSVLGGYRHDGLPGTSGPRVIAQRGGGATKVLPCQDAELACGRGLGSKVTTLGDI